MNTNWFRFILVIINCVLLILCIIFYFNYAVIYEYQVHQMKIIYFPSDPEILAREDEIKNLFLFTKLIMGGVLLNIVIVLFFIKRLHQ